MEDIELQQTKEKALMDAVSYSHLYHQQHVIDEYKIDHAEYVSRMAAQGLTASALQTIMAENADRLQGDDHIRGILQKAIDLF